MPTLEGQVPSAAPLKHSRQGKRYPWLLTLPQTFICTGVVFLGNVAILIALIMGAAQNREVLEQLAREVELQPASIPPEPPPPEPAPEPVRAGAGAPAERTGTAERTLRVSAPDDWHWTGCRADSGGVEILFSPPDSPR